MAINAHLYFGDYMADRRQEFDALMVWILARVNENDRAYYPNFILLGDLNLDFDNPRTDRKRIEKHMRPPGRRSFRKERNAKTSTTFGNGVLRSGILFPLFAPGGSVPDGLCPL